MKALSYLVAFTMAICGFVVIELPASAAAADITGTWEVTIHYPSGDYYSGRPLHRPTGLQPLQRQ